MSKRFRLGEKGRISLLDQFCKVFMAKTYSVSTPENETKKAKGIAKNIMKKNYSDNYKSIIENGCTIYCKIYVFKSTLHNTYMELKKNVVVSFFNFTAYKKK